MNQATKPAPTQAKPAHRHVIHTRFNIGDRVRFDSKHQHCSGTGTVFAFTVEADGYIDYTIEVDGEVHRESGRSYPVSQPGIEADCMTLLDK
jgi:hypothetical protein